MTKRKITVEGDSRIFSSPEAAVRWQTDHLHLTKAGAEQMAMHMTIGLLKAEIAELRDTMAAVMSYIADHDAELADAINERFIKPANHSAPVVEE